MTTARRWLCLPVVVVIVLDATMTLAGQQADYWGGDFSSVHEINPIGRLLLSRHPAAFAIAVALWLMIVCAGVLMLSQRWAVPLAFVVVVGHSIGVATWLVALGWFGWGLAVAFLIGVERLLSFALRREGRT